MNDNKVKCRFLKPKLQKDTICVLILSNQTNFDSIGNNINRKMISMQGPFQKQAGDGWRPQLRAVTHVQNRQ